jgi:hypothetical protein
MSIAASVPWSIPKLRRSGMFSRRFMESSNVRRTCIVAMNSLENSLMILPLSLCSLRSLRLNQFGSWRVRGSRATIRRREYRLRDFRKTDFWLRVSAGLLPRARSGISP